MSGGMVDGVNDYFLVYHDGTSMHFEGERSLVNIAELAMRKHTSLLEPEKRREALADLNQRMNECFESWEEEYDEDYDNEEAE